MKKLLLITAAVATFLSAGAQLKCHTMTHDIAIKSVPAMELVKPNPRAFNCVEGTINEPGQVKQGPKRALGTHDVYYTRPGGAFANYAVTDVDGNYLGNYSFTMIYQKPFEWATLTAHIRGVEDISTLQKEWFYTNPDDVYDEYYCSDDNMRFYTYRSFWNNDALPKFRVLTDSDPLDDPYGGMNGNWITFPPEDVWGNMFEQINLFQWLSLPTTDAVYGEDGLLGYGYKFYWTQKAFLYGGMFGDGPFNMLTLVDGLGAPGIDPNKNAADTALLNDGSYFGKNSGVWKMDDNNRWYQAERVGGFAQVFEKPEHPYLLKDLAVEFYLVTLDEPVDMECKIYKLEEVPAYDDQVSVTLPHVPGELIATGRTTLRPEKIDTMYSNNSAFAIFTLYGEDDGLECALTPTIDCPIMVTFEGYNDIPALKDFTALIGSDYHYDDGHGETAYILCEHADENHEFHGDDRWCGLNNFFTKGEMKTGFNVALNIDYPFLKTTAGGYFVEDTVFTFKYEGGEMQRSITVDTDDGEQTFEVNGIEFWSWYPSAEGQWELTWNGSDDLPDWLDIQLEDGEVEYQSIKIDQQGNTAPLRLGLCVTAMVTADPLPLGINYREATIRFDVPGEYRYFTFKQGNKIFVKGDVDNDGEVSIADVTSLIDIILDSTVFTHDMINRCDVNEDSQVDIADVIAIIDAVLE